MQSQKVLLLSQIQRGEITALSIAQEIGGRWRQRPLPFWREPIGIEIAQAYVRLGAHVTVLEAKSILEKDDPESVKILVGQLKKDGIKILENSEVVYIENDDKNIKVRTSDGSIYKEKQFCKWYLLLYYFQAKQEIKL